jgi:TPR repeat protein
MDPENLKKDYAKAYQHNYAGYQLGHPEGASNIGLLYEYGWGRDKNLNEAERWYNIAMANSFHSAQAEIAILRLYLVYKFKAFDITKIDGMFIQAQIKLQHPAWESSRPQWQRELYELGLLYQKLRNENTSSTSKSVSAKSDKVEAQSPKSTTAPDKNAKKWLSNNPWFNTEKEMQDYAIELHNKLVANGNIEIGSNEYYGRIDAAIHERYRAYFDNLELNKIKTAKNQYEAGWKFMVGDGVVQDLKEAKKWFTISAESGNSDAQSVLALMYEKGNGVKQDMKKAAYWYNKAAKQGDIDAINWVKLHGKKN